MSGAECRVSAECRVEDINAVVGGYLRDLASIQTDRQKGFGYKRAAAAILSLGQPLTALVDSRGVLQKIAAQAATIDGRHVAPVAWDCNCLEEVCGSCTMVINGRTRMACTALVDRLRARAEDLGQPAAAGPAIEIHLP